MSHACHCFWKCYKTLTFCSLLTRCTIPCACHAKRHLNVKKWSEHAVFMFCSFLLRNVLRATTACIFSTSQLQKVLRTWCALCILTSKCASRHNGVHFFEISTSKSGPDQADGETTTSKLNAAQQQDNCFHNSIIDFCNFPSDLANSHQILRFAIRICHQVLPYPIIF